jgi:hypothetical protein
MKESPLLGIEIIEEGDHPGVIESFIAEPLTDMGPVFLFDMGVIVLVIGSASGELDGAFSPGEVAKEMVVEELRSVIGVKPKQREGQRLLDMVDLLEDAGFSLSPDRSLFAPARGDIDTVNGVGEHPREGLSTVGHGIGFEKTRARFVPLVGVDGDMFSQEGSWFGGGSASFAILNPHRAEQPVHGGWRDTDQGCEGLWRERAIKLDVSGKPKRHQGFEAF